MQFVADLPEGQYLQLGTRPGRRALGSFEQSVGFCRWMLDGVEPERLAVGFEIGRSTAHRDVSEALSVVAEQAPGLHSALLAPHRRAPPVDVPW